MRQAHLPDEFICATTNPPQCLTFARVLRMFAHVVPSGDTLRAKPIVYYVFSSAMVDLPGQALLNF